VSPEPESTQSAAGPGSEPPPAEEEPKLRRGPFGYRKADVIRLLERRQSDLGSREAELAELRQDIAALWLAFAQHDRMLRRALGEEEQPAPPTAEPSPPAAETGDPPPTAERVAVPPPPAPVGDDAAIGRQLSDLDDVLAAIELATQTLERTYVDVPAGKGEQPEPPADPPAER
jgi:hypothetical protein